MKSFQFLASIFTPCMVSTGFDVWHFGLGTVQHFLLVEIIVIRGMYLPFIQEITTDEKFAISCKYLYPLYWWEKKCFKCDDRSQFLVRRVNTSCMTISPHNKMFCGRNASLSSSKYGTFLLQKVERKKFFAQQFSLYLFSLQWQENCTQNRTETIQSKSNKGFAT